MMIVCDGIAGFHHCDHIGQFLKSCDFEFAHGRGHATWTKDPSEAMKFPDAATAMRYWATQSKTMPTRPDGKPNRPLTAYHVSFVD